MEQVDNLKTTNDYRIKYNDNEVDETKIKDGVKESFFRKYELKFTHICLKQASDENTDQLRSAYTN